MIRARLCVGKETGVGRATGRPCRVTALTPRRSDRTIALPALRVSTAGEGRPVGPPFDMNATSYLGDSLRGTLSRAAGAVLDLLLPLSCAVCNREGRFLCTECEPSLPRLEHPYCSICVAPGTAGLCHWCATSPPAMDEVTAPYTMDGAARELVHRLKYRNLRALAPGMAGLMARHLESHPMDADVLIPVPLHPRRERARGYNQSELLTRGLSRLTGLPSATGVLHRHRDTAPQVEMESREERRLNIEGAFACSTDLAGQSVLLVDDVVSTGGTVSACAAPLKGAGARSVSVLVLAR